MENTIQLNEMVGRKVYIANMPEIGECEIIIAYKGYANEIRVVVRDNSQNDRLVKLANTIPTDKAVFTLVQDWVDDGNSAERKVIMVSKNYGIVEKQMKDLTAQEIEFQNNEERDWVREHSATSFSTFPEGEYPNSHFDLNIYVNFME